MIKISEFLITTLDPFHAKHHWILHTLIMLSLVMLIPLTALLFHLSTSAKPVSSDLDGIRDTKNEIGSSLSDANLPCKNPGWFPVDFGLKDHSVFWYDGYYYLISIHLPDEKYFAYGRSVDLCQWEILSPVLTSRLPGAWDENTIWSPFVYEEGGIFYLFYTGVTDNYTQSIMLAISTNPADSNSWQTHGVVFQPNHGSSLWRQDAWTDCRDPSVIKVGHTYYMYYTSRDVIGGIIGLATAESPWGPWKDWGAILPPSKDMLESPTMIQFGDHFYLFYHLSGNTSKGEYFHIGDSPSGPWRKPGLFPGGWAHEVWKSPSGEWFTSFLTDHKVTISPLIWDESFLPPLPIIGSKASHLFMPLISRWNPP